MANNPERISKDEADILDVLKVSEGNLIHEAFRKLDIGSVDLDDHLTDSSLAVSCSLLSDLVLVVRLAYTN